jgi:thiol-disulfide isomerase/thioredoxin
MNSRIGLVLAVIVLKAAILRGDAIYLNNGNVIVAEKAWEEGDEVRYQVGSSTQTIPRAAVKRLQGQKATPADPSHKQPVGVEVIRGTSAPAVTSPEPKHIPSSATTAIGPDGKSLRFRDSGGYEEALRLQKETGKPVALYFYVDWCPYCARLERGILGSEGVKRFLNDILYVSVNPEHGKAEEDLFLSFKGTGFPTFLMLAKNQSARKIWTSLSPDAFVQACQAATKAGSH